VAGNSTETGRSVTSKVIAILMTFTDGSMHSLTEIARLAGLPISTAHRLASELTARGALERTEDGNYRVGLPLRMIGTCPSHPPNIQERAPRVMEDLCDATRAVVRLGVFDDLEVAYIEKTPGHRPVTVFSAAATLPAHATALGKALLAFTSPHVVDLVIERGLKAFTPYTLTTPDRLRRALAVTRLTRIAVCRWELALGVSTVAAPVFGVGGQLVAALEVQIRDLRCDLQVVQPALMVAGHSLSRELATSPRLGRVNVGVDYRPGNHVLDGPLSGGHLPDGQHPGGVDLPRCGSASRSWPGGAGGCGSPSSPAGRRSR
jgi:DNA-binding IclR family transcriptional regulator